MRFSGHCLHDILQPVSNQCYDMRKVLIDLFYHSVTAFFTRNHLSITACLKNCKFAVSFNLLMHARLTCINLI